jgi:hypothetical protein
MSVSNTITRSSVDTLKAMIASDGHVSSRASCRLVEDGYR